MTIATLDEQIMDELTDQRMTIAELAESLAADSKLIQHSINRLELRGLVHAVDAKPARGGGAGRPQLVYDMIRMRKSLDRVEKAA